VTAKLALLILTVLSAITTRAAFRAADRGALTTAQAANLAATSAQLVLLAVAIRRSVFKPGGRSGADLCGAVVEGTRRTWEPDTRGIRAGHTGQGNEVTRGPGAVHRQASRGTYPSRT
jgi:hypothetical protein